MKFAPAKFASAKFALFVLLSLQLVFGLQLQAGQPVSALGAMAPAVDTAAAVSVATATATTATATTAAPATVATAQHDCPTHAHARGGVSTAGDADAGNPALSTDALAANPLSAGGHHGPTGGHTCCHAGACQCQCVNPPVAIDLPALADITTSVAIPSLASAQFLGPRIDEFLRPPIA